MKSEEVIRIGEIDRRERIAADYVMEEGRLKAQEVNWDVPTWFAEGEGERSDMNVALRRYVSNSF